MKLELRRKIRTDEYTIGELWIDNKCFIDTLEDVDRGLSSTMSEEFIRKIKVAGATAIPIGTYELVLDMSTRFAKLMPHILNVKGFAGIRIHAGNTAHDSSGCVLLGTYNGGDTIVKSKVAVGLFMSIIDPVLKKGEKITIEIR